MSFITGWIQDKASGYLKTGLQAGGTMAGNAVGGVGSLVESSGRSAGQGVTGAIGGVGSYINGYGDTIIKSMSSDGPVSGGGQKKTAVAAAGQAQKKGQAAQKALPSSKSAAGGAAAAPAKGSTAQRSKSLPATNHLPSSKPPGASSDKKTPDGKSRTNPQSRPGGTPAGQKPGASRSASSVGRPSSNLNPNKSSPNARSDGKVRISAQSRPRPGGQMRSVAPAGPKSAGGTGAANKPPISVPKSVKAQSGGDPLGIGADFGKIGDEAKK